MRLADTRPIDPKRNPFPAPPPWLDGRDATRQLGAGDLGKLLIAAARRAAEAQLPVTPATEPRR